MIWVMFLVYIAAANADQTAYEPVMVKSYHESQEKCAEAGKALLEKLENDDKVVKILVGTCLPSAKSKS